MKVIIDRTKWIRGNPAKSALLVDGKMCCLGFHALACGYTNEQMEGVRTPMSLMSQSHVNNYPVNMAHIMPMGELEKGNTVWQLMHINDDPDIDVTDAMREQEIIELGKQIDIEFEFIN